jgi:probable rRNA maturation factor
MTRATAAPAITSPDSSAMSVIGVEVEVPCAAWRRLCPSVEAIASTAARAAAQNGSVGIDDGAVIGLRLTDDAEQRRLNRTYRGKDATTNVLAFALSDPPAAVHPATPVLLGDVVLACGTVEREAAEQGKLFADHLRHLVVHGVLHLLGFDHQSEAEAAAMEALEVKILAELGVPDPYREIM